MQSSLVKVVGFLLIGGCLLGLALTTISAWRAGKPTIGENFYGMPVGTVEAAAVLAVGAVALVILWVRRLARQRD